MNSKELLFWKTWPFCIQTSKLTLKLVKLSPFCIKETFRRRSWPGDKTINLMKSFRSVCIHSLLHFDFKIALIFYSIYWRNLLSIKVFISSDRGVLNISQMIFTFIFKFFWLTPTYKNNHLNFHSPKYIVLLQDWTVGLGRQIKIFVFLAN